MHEAPIHGDGADNRLLTLPALEAQSAADVLGKLLAAPEVVAYLATLITRSSPQPPAMGPAAGEASSWPAPAVRPSPTPPDKELRANWTATDSPWNDPVFAHEPLSRLFDQWLISMSTGPNKLSPRTTRKYSQDRTDFLRALERLDIPAVLGSVNPNTVARWTQDMERRGLRPSTIGGRVIGLKTFASKFVYRELELTRVDLLRKVSRPDPPVVPPEVLTEEERERLLGCYDRDTFEDIRDRALLATFMATGMRFTAVRTLTLGGYDRVTGEFTTVEKGQVRRLGQLSPRAMRYLREYLARRPRTALTEQLWTTAEGNPLSESGLQMVFRRARQRSGISRLHAHLFRHGVGSHAAESGLGIAEIQTILGHRTPAMARRYAGRALDRQGARLMAKYSPIG